MVVPRPRHRYTYAEYLAHDKESVTKNEFFDGDIFAMAGGTPEHAAFAVNVTAALATQLRGSGCRVHSSDLRIRVLATGLATYPDVSVVCGHAELDPEDRNTVTNPILLVEVASPSTADYDRGEKLEHYQRIPALREVVLVAHDERALTLWRRGADDTWTSLRITEGQVRLAAVPATLDIDDVYRDELAR